MASNDRAVVFISSSASELEAEREVVEKVVRKLADGTFETYISEEDAIPFSDETPHEQRRHQLERTAFTIVLLHRKLGAHTEEEIRLSEEMGVPVLVFRKKDEDRTLEQTAPEFVDRIEDVETGIITKWFDTPKELKQGVRAALSKQIMNSLETLQGVRRASPSVDGMDIESRRSEELRVHSVSADAESRLPEVGRVDPSDEELVASLAEHLGITTRSAETILRNAELEAMDEPSDRDSGTIFISYSRDDHEYVDELVSYLGGHGLTCWIDKSGIDYGARWETEIETNIEACSAFVVVMSPSSKERRWVRREIEQAEMLDKPILPLLLEGTRFFSLSDIQYESVIGGLMPPKRWVDQLDTLVRRSPS